ncbi:hypothetical protein AB4Z01_34435 [Inquilinus sp. YAF38]|uniref:hypothetical protein n=1 Tax=Inquilinus sp. YAF38 TaxID=3233084 RepID=UPI003F8EBA30
MDFSNREIAGYIWLALFLGATALNRGVRAAFIDLLRMFFKPLILIPLGLAGVYISAWVVVFAYVGIWTTTNLKTTILWALSFAFATMFDINRVSEDRTFFTKAVREAFAITGVLTFMVEFYSFSLPVELIAVPLLTLLGTIHIAAGKPEHAQVKRLTGGLLAVIGLSYLGYSFYRTALDLKAFATLDNIREFGLPILLTLFFLPFLYALVVYVVYERSFVGLMWAIPDSKLRKRAKWQAILAFGPKLDLLQRWVASVQRFNPTNLAALRRSYHEIQVSAQREANPPAVASESGWSPYLAKDFLKEKGLPTRPYHRSHEDEWFAGSNYLEIGEGFGHKNNIAYYLNGNEHTATELKLKLNINTSDARDDAERRFREIGLTLLLTAMGREPDHTIIDGINADSFNIQVGMRRIDLETHVWQGGIPGGYSRSLTIRTMNDA